MDNEKVAERSVNISNVIELISIGAILMGTYIDNSLLVMIPAWYSVIMITIGTVILLVVAITFGSIADTLSPDTERKVVDKYSKRFHISFSRVLGWLVVISLFVAGLVYIPIYLIALEIVATGIAKYIANVALPKFIKKNGG